MSRPGSSPTPGWRASVYRVARRARGERPFGILASLRASETWDPARLREAQETRLRALLAHAAARVPHYRAMLRDAGVVGGDGRVQVDLSRLGSVPPLSRATVRERAASLLDRQMVARTRGRWVQSGGTTGEPVRVFRDRGSHDHALAVTHWFDEWAGYAVGQPKVAVWARLTGASPGSRRGFARALGAFLRNETRLSCNVLSPDVIDEHVRRIGRIRPTLVLGYPSALHAIARRARATGQRIAPPRAVMSSGEALSPEARVAIEEAFGAAVFDRYGSDDFGGVACECERHRGLHVSALTQYVEVVRPDGRPAGPGELGEILVTCLTSAAMPLIRYRTGDLGILDPGACPCGRPFPLLRAVTGRVTDAFVRRDGSLVHGLFLHGIYRRRDWIERFQVVQEDLDRVVVRLVPRGGSVAVPEPPAGELTAIAAHVRAAMGSDCAVTFEFPREIPLAPSGKFRTTVSLVRR